MGSHEMLWEKVLLCFFFYRTYRGGENLVEGLWKFCEKMESFFL
jgi:hypothetical protein